MILVSNSVLRYSTYEGEQVNNTHAALPEYLCEWLVSHYQSSMRHCLPILLTAIFIVMTRRTKHYIHFIISILSLFSFLYFARSYNILQSSTKTVMFSIETKQKNRKFRRLCSYTYTHVTNVGNI